MAKIIIEVVNVLGHVLERHKFGRLPIKIGRGYNNDLILSDPYLSPEHIKIEAADTGWQIIDLESDNGFTIKSEHAHTSNAINSGMEVIIGKTRLRLYSPDHPVAPTHVLPASNEFTQTANNTLVMLAALVITLSLYLTNYYLVTSREIPFIKLLAASLPAIISAAFWAGIWAFAGHMIKHKANFKLQFTVSLSFIAALMLITTLKEYTLYISSSVLVTTLVEILLTGTVLTILFLINLHYATNATRKTRLLTSNGVAWGIISISLFFNYAQKPEFSLSPSFPSVLKPPFANIVPHQTMDHLLSDSKKLFTTANAD